MSVRFESSSPVDLSTEYWSIELVQTVDHRTGRWEDICSHGRVREQRRWCWLDGIVRCLSRTCCSCENESQWNCESNRRGIALGSTCDSSTFSSTRSIRSHAMPNSECLTGCHPSRCLHPSVGRVHCSTIHCWSVHRRFYPWSPCRRHVDLPTGYCKRSNDQDWDIRRVPSEDTFVSLVCPSIERERDEVPGRESAEQFLESRRCCCSNCPRRSLSCDNHDTWSRDAMDLGDIPIDNNQHNPPGKTKKKNNNGMTSSSRDLLERVHVVLESQSAWSRWDWRNWFEDILRFDCRSETSDTNHLLRWPNEYERCVQRERDRVLNSLETTNRVLRPIEYLVELGTYLFESFERSS